MEFSHCNNAYFHWRIETRQWNVQGFWAKSLKTLHWNKANLALNALAFKACGLVQYAL